MAAAKKQSNRRGTAKTTSGRKNTRKKQTRKQVKKQGVTSGFQTEIILLTILAASIILIISNLGMGGVVGAAISKASFGIMGLLAYVFPVLIFVGAAFLVSNSKNPLAYKKALAALVFFVFLCGLVQLLTEGYMSSTTMWSIIRPVLHIERVVVCLVELSAFLRLPHLVLRGDM